jgi:hypothetical protein
MRRPLLLLPLLAVFLLFPATVAGSAAYVLQINLYGDNVVPPVETESYGFVRFFFNQDRSEADYTLDVKGHSNSAVTGVTINEGAPGENGPVVMTLSEGNFIVTSGHLTLTPEQLQQFTSGNWYLSLTTVFNPEGEIRGQIVVPADFYTGVGGSWYPAPAEAPTQPPVVEVTPPADSGAPAGAPSGGETGGGTGLIQPPNTGDAGLK